MQLRAHSQSFPRTAPRRRSGTPHGALRRVPAPLKSVLRPTFREVHRVARHAIIALPIDWHIDDPRNPHHGISHERVLSWFVPTAPTRVIVGNPGYRQRLIYTFENLG